MAGASARFGSGEVQARAQPASGSAQLRAAGARWRLEGVRMRKLSRIRRLTGA
jgi:hypothetical protein